MSRLDEPIFLSLDREHVVIKTVATISRAKSTVVKIELEITDAYCLARLVETLHEARILPAKRARPTRSSGTPA